MSEKRRFFQDLKADCGCGDMTFAASGIIVSLEIRNPEAYKDAEVLYFNPFDGCVERRWRGISEIIVWEYDDDCTEYHEWEYVKNFLEITEENQRKR